MGYLPLKTHDAARRQLSALIRDFKRQEGQERDIGGFRALVFAFGTLLQYFKHEADLEIEQRIEAIEQRLDEQK